MGDIILRDKLGGWDFFLLSLGFRSVWIFADWDGGNVLCDTRTIDSESESGETDILYKQASKTGE